MRYGGYQVSIGPRLTPVVKALIIANAACFFVSFFVPGTILVFGLIPAYVVGKLFVWQLATYLFLHGGFWHLFFNMLTLWMFGSELEQRWGGTYFLRYYFITGIGAGVCSLLAHPFSRIPSIGASGAIYGILAAYALLFPNRYVYIYLLVPVQVKYLVIVMAAIALMSAFGTPGDPVDHVAHLGGMLVGFLYLKGWTGPARLRESYLRWKLRRMRKKFRVCDTKSDDDRYVH